MRLDDLRRQIDDLDVALADLLCRRADIVRQIGEAKREQQTPIHDQEREAKVLAHVGGLARGPLSGENLKRIFREIMAVCTGIQENTKPRRRE